MNERECITDLATNEEISFEQLFKTNYSKLIFFANKFVNDMEEAEELVSDVFAALWENKDKYTFSPSFHGFLFKMVQNRCLNYLKHKKVENEYINYLYKHKLIHESSIFEEEKVIAKEFEKHIAEAIENLPERCKAVFKLSRFKHKKNKEIATILNISNKTVERQITIALEKLRFGLQNLISLLLFLFI
ncbi:RNA polymerase sigma-70 factor [Pseudopedobacter sp.]|uniref:RNA polymerase sigma-70 factor n=1 Tax=Pseudopedobacter sp. TaxID=1936787 RepID=UPI0033426F7D